MIGRNSGIDAAAHAVLAAARMFPRTRTSSLLYALVSIVWCGCAPPTREVVASTPVVAAPTSAVLVVYRPRSHGLHGVDEPNAPPFRDDRFSVVRIVDEAGTPIADLGPTEHGVLTLEPGKHDLFATEWDLERDPTTVGPRHPTCVGVLRADVAAGKVYAARLEIGGFDGSAFDFCRRVDFVAVPRDQEYADDERSPRAEHSLAGRWTLTNRPVDVADRVGRFK